MSVDQTAPIVKRQNTTRDAFLGGRLTLSQPKRGFRAGSDSVLLGASVPTDMGRILDLGAGIGAAGLVAAFWAQDAEVLLAERDPDILALARGNIEDNGLAARVRAVEIDLTAPGAERRAAGLLPDRFDCVIANPPYFQKGRGTPAGEAGRDAARHDTSEGIACWIRVAAATAAPRGEAIFILPAARLGEVLTAFESRFGGLRILPVAARPGAEAKRVMIRAVKGSRAQMSLLSPLILHGETGNGFTPQTAEILMGERNFTW